MKFFLTLCTFIFLQTIFAQKTKTLWIEPEGIIVKGTVAVETSPTLYVGHEYEFTIMSNYAEFDLIIDSKNLKIALDESSKKNTGGLIFKVIALDTGTCNIVLTLGKDKERKANLISRSFKAVNYPAPPVYIGDVRSGEVLTEVKETTELKCKYDPASGIFESYPVESWQAKLGDRTFSGTGTKLTKELVNAINSVSSKEILEMTVQLKKNNTGFRISEAVYLIR